MIRTRTASAVTAADVARMRAQPIVVPEATCRHTPPARASTVNAKTRRPRAMSSPSRTRSKRVPGRSRTSSAPVSAPAAGDQPEPGRPSVRARTTQDGRSPASRLRPYTSATAGPKPVSDATSAGSPRPDVSGGTFSRSTALRPTDVS
ncbi:hypothetical protein GCM10023082_60390 [Streptomyces tremellae]|uniref:Uncharacterized protein n=1 Tax=Streptomyces tremellae TaxID=1124239 RepID=A0ABP7G714_9ACTN